MNVGYKNAPTPCEDVRGSVRVLYNEENITQSCTREE